MPLAGAFDRPLGHPEVLVVGEALVDVISRPPHAPVARPGGSPANVAVGLGRFGHPVTLLTMLGDDAHGACLRQHFAAAGVRVLAARASRTSTARVEIRPGAQPAYAFDVHWDLAGAPPTPAAGWLHVGSVAAVMPPGAERVAEIVAAHEGVVSFDPNCRPALEGHPRTDAVEALMSRSMVVKLSEEDAAWLYPGRAHDLLVDQLLELGPQVVAITQGDRGAIAGFGNERMRIDVAPGRDVIDAVGAGDAFMAGLISGLLDGDAVPDALRRAAWAARRTCERAGADMPNRHDWQLAGTAS